MIDKPLLPHFLFRQGTRDYMVYDRFTPGPAKLGGAPAIGLPQEEAIRLRDWLAEHPPGGSEQSAGTIKRPSAPQLGCWRNPWSSSWERSWRTSASGTVYRCAIS